MENLEVIDVDTMLWHAGDFGRFQFILIMLFSVINAFSAFHYFGQTFISLEPEHRCIVENNEGIATSCGVSFANGTVEPCSQWEYNSSYGYISLVQELDWVCGDYWKSSVGQSVFFGGSLIGSLLLGILADRIGRVHVLVIANLLAFLGNFCTIFVEEAVSYSIIRFIAGCASDTNFVMMYMIVMEYLRPSMRTMGLNLTIGIFYCISSILVPWIAVLCGNWRNFLLVISMPHLVVGFFYFLVPESAQWLISRGKFAEAMKCFQRIAKTNKRQIPDKAIQGLKLYATENIKEGAKNESFFGLLKTPKLRRKTIILIFKSMVLNLCYDAIARNVNGLGLSPFIIFSATSVTILPGCLVILLLQDRIGRKALASSSLFLGGIIISIAGIILASFDSPSLTLILTVIARLNVVVAYNSGSQYAFELIPTVVRAQGVSVVHVAGFAATFFSPQILYLSTFWKPLPEIVLGILLLMCAVLCLFLPETFNKTLPVTLQDGENFGENEDMFKYCCCFKKDITESTIVLNEA
ncbi:PREDICTED: organic cation transporter protein-like [Nicrophorus vespilloides]|uniref:Organic cation transporter protein-like n=1 Tax=Nicrophorus vespilloides TaxID=110193 RepID=A0ABM1MYQ8_NICVS|nr:PREDICTED: organic cation transporter protein-like [Nicrophorus vespilloides]